MPIRSSTLRNSSKMGDALKNWLNLLFGPEFDDSSKVRCPSGSTISRGRAKVDVALMILRRRFWAENWKNSSIQLGY